jgi:hypothetical protein
MRRLLALAVGTVVCLALLAGPAAARRSPRPTARLLGTGTIDFGAGPEHYIEVEAVDPDGIITEVTIWWGDGSISFAHSYPCLIPPIPEPGTPHRFLVSNPYENPGRYRVRYVVSSTSDCSGKGGEQHSHPYTARLTVP